MKSMKFMRNVGVGLMAAGALAILYAAYLHIHAPSIQRESQLKELLSWGGQELWLASRTQEAECEAQGPLPDPECTPGAIFSNATKEEVCQSGYSKTVRNVSTSLKKKVFAQYGIRYPVPFGSYEIDHLIPLSLGGSNDIANLWPKAAQPFPGFYEKNLTGNYLREEVCLGRVDLAVAQYQIAKDWFLIYNNLDPKIIEELKQRYKNWADR